MLRDLHIRNLAVLEEAVIEFRPGFNVLSGETGAGKSIVVDSLSLLAGARASADLIRTGADRLMVSGRFEPTGENWQIVLAQAGLEHDNGELIIRREVSRNGRNRVFVNDQPVTLKLLVALAPSLLRIHGQREELGLVAPDLQRVWLDRCGGAEGERLLRQTATAHTTYCAVAERLERLTGDDRARHERLDFLRFQLSEIEAADVQVGEEVGLRQQREALRHSEAIRHGLGSTLEALFDQENSAYEGLSRAAQLLREIDLWEQQAGDWASELEELSIRVAEIERSMRQRLDHFNTDPARLDEIEDRLAVLERLFRKYGSSSGEVLEQRAAIVLELAELESDEGHQSELEEKAARALAEYRKAAEALSAGRRRWLKKLVRSVEKQLNGLALGKARFDVVLSCRRLATSPLRIQGEAVDFSSRGIDQVTFVFSPNPGEEMRPLARVASGGELSRLYLAVQLAVQNLGSKQAAPTLVFDEVDTGIGGAEAAAIGAKLHRLAQDGQVLAVTHLPQVASRGDAHFKVSKEVSKGRTRTELQQLENSHRVAEIARMLAGSEVTDLSLSHARELLAGTHG